MGVTSGTGTAYCFEPPSFSEIVFTFLFSLLWVCNLINTTGDTSRAGTAYPSGAHESIPGFALLDLQFYVHVL